MFVFFDCLWKFSIALLSVTFAAFRVIEYLSSTILDIQETEDLALYSQFIHIVSALLFVISILSRNTPITVLTILTLICQSVFTFKHYFHRVCTTTEVSFTGTSVCTNAQVIKYLDAFNRELFAIYMVAVTAVICILCLSLYINHLERCIQKITDMCDPNSSNDQPKTSVVSVPNMWREVKVVRSARHDSGNFSV